jgi:cell wall-associated NlpC family hydrolase
MAGIMLVLACTIALSPLAAAQPLDQKRADAQQEVSQLEQRLESAVERYKSACAKLEDTRARINENKSRLDETEQELAARQATLNKRVRAMYMSRNSRFVDVAVGAHNFDEFLVGLDLVKKVGHKDASLVSNVKATKAKLEASRSELKSLKSQQEEATQAMASSKAAVESELKNSKGKLANVEEQIRQAMIRQAAEAEAANARRMASAGVDYSVLYRSVPPGTPHPGVVQVAYAQLGKPYVWGATGPNSFDCSGLTSYCYRHGAGMEIPRNSYDQAVCGPRVSVSELQPGDILGFRGWGHVGLYIGGGQFIQAPHTGDVVKISVLSTRGDYAGAVRP